MRVPQIGWETTVSSAPTSRRESRVFDTLCCRVFGSAKKRLRGPGSNNQRPPPYYRPSLIEPPLLPAYSPQHHSPSTGPLSAHHYCINHEQGPPVAAALPHSGSKALTEIMQFLIRSGTTHVIHSDDAASLSSMISQRTGIPEASLLLSHAGRSLDVSSFATLSDSSTIHASYRIPGGAIKKRCQQKECTAPALRGLDCSLCAGHFCSKHRLLEQHACSGLANCKEELRRANQAKLESERCVAPKVV